MTWNLLEGCHVPQAAPDSPGTMDPVRLAAAQSLITQVAPDVLVLNEALWCRPVDGRHVDYAHLFGFEHQYGDIYDGAWGNVIISNRPLTSHRRFRIHNRGGLVVQLEHEGHPLMIATYHPHPSRYPAHKTADYTRLLHELPDHALAVCGDFNAISPEDQPDEVALTQAFARFTATPATDVARFTNGGRAVFQALSAMGLRDAVEPDARQHTMPTKLVSVDGASGMRLDHIWINARLSATKAHVVTGDLADVASDHYPVVADLWIRP